MKVLVTGGAGFIGSNLVDGLIKNGADVTVLDDLSTGKMDYLHSECEFVEGELKDISTLLKDLSFDTVFHLAAQTDVVTSIENPQDDAEINILQALELLKFCKTNDVRKIIFSSTSAAYGEPKYLPIDEKHPKKPLCGYGVSKLSFEKYLYFYNQVFDLDFTVLRYGNAYGPRQSPFLEGGVIAIFTYQILNNKPSLIFGDGEQTRDFVFVEDIVNANILAIEKGSKEDFNIGTQTEISINQLYSVLAKVNNSDNSPIYKPERKGEMKYLILNNQKAKENLGWVPQYSLESGLRKTIDYYKKIK